ncbi:MAG: response regulator transcription factor [Polyangiaceae bacterium]|nr:response regulator transcription factor [Polyangiaceae bacterium]
MALALGKLSVFVVEDDDLLREMVSEVLSDAADIEVAGTASNPRDALAAIDGSVDVAIVDLGLGEESGIDLIAALKHRFPTLQLMAHTVFDDRDSVFRALRSGATSYLLKGDTPTSLVDAVRQVASGGAPMNPRIARLVVEQLRAAAEPDLLSPRERQILKCIDRGLTYKEIAIELSISTHTVHSHIKNIYERLQATDKRDALARARSRGLL